MTRPPRELFASLDDLISLDSLAAIEQRSLRDVRREPYSSVDSLSGSQLSHVETLGVDAERRSYVVKRINHEWDWVMRATGDRHGRAVLAWHEGLLDIVPDEIDHTVVACARDGDGFALLMRDVRADLVPPGDAPISHHDNDTFLRAMAALHATYWERHAAATPERGYISLREHYQCLSPQVARRLGRDGDVVPPMVIRGWERLPELVDADIVDIIEPLLADTQPLCDALQPFAVTVVHGDWKLGNMGLRHGNTPITILLDWDRVGAGPPSLDLAWYLAVNSARLPVAREQTIALYQRHLAHRLGERFDLAWWEPQLALGLLGGFVQLGWPKLLGAASDDPLVRDRERSELAWWSARIREAAALL